METKKGLSFTLIIVAIIVGGALYKHTDFSTFTFEKPALDVVYLITFLICMVVLVRNVRRK